MKNQKKIFFATVVLIGMLALGSMIGSSGTSAFASEAATIHAVDLSSYPAQTIAGVTVHPQAMRVRENAVDLSLCFDLPELGDWIPIANIVAGDVTLDEASVTLQNHKDPATIASLHRCYDFEFPNQLTESSEVTVLVPQLVKVIDPLSQAGFKEVIAEIEELNSGVDVEFVVSHDESGGGASLQINSKPESMSDTDIYEMVLEASQQELILNAAFDVSMP